MEAVDNFFSYQSCWLHVRAVKPADNLPTACNSCRSCPQLVKDVKVVDSFKEPSKLSTAFNSCQSCQHESLRNSIEKKKFVRSPRWVCTRCSPQVHQGRDEHCWSSRYSLICQFLQYNGCFEILSIISYHINQTHTMSLCSIIQGSCLILHRWEFL